MMNKANRKTQYYLNVEDGVWCYFIKRENTPCRCGSNCYHHEYDGSVIKCVCNACDTDIYEIKEEYTNEKLNNGIWK
jgi:hypothetical protein